MYHCRSFMQHIQKASSRRDPNGSPALIARAVLYSALLLLHLHEKARESCWKVASANQFGEIEGGISEKLHMPCTQCRSSCVYIRAPTVARCLKSERQGCCPKQIFKFFFFFKVQSECFSWQTVDSSVILGIMSASINPTHVFLNWESKITSFPDHNVKNYSGVRKKPIFQWVSLNLEACNE